MSQDLDNSIAHSEDATSVEITRDHTFTRHTADRGWVLDLGRDVEVSFTQNSPSVLSRLRRGGPEEHEEGIQLGSNVVEVSRIRMSPYGLLSLAVNSIEVLIDKDAIKIDVLLDTIKKMGDNEEEVEATEKAESEEPA